MGESKRAFLVHVQPLSRKLDLVARQYAATSQDACDLVQETLLRGWRSFSPDDERTYSPAWLFVIMRNIAYYTEFSRKTPTPGKSRPSTR